MLKPIIIVLLFCYFTEPILAGSDIEFAHRSLKKTLSKEGVKNMACLEEIDLPDSIASVGSVNGKYFIINKDTSSPFKFIYVGRVNSCRAGGCSITNNSANSGSSEYFDYFIIYDAQKVVKAVKVFNYRATHGHEITAKGWLRQFVGHTASESLQVDKNIDSISGATISVYGITRDIQQKTKLLKSLAVF